MSAPRIKTVTLGCKVNQYETEFVREGLLGVGYEDADDETSADLCVVNTCTVTSEGDSKSRQVVRQLARRNPGAKIIVMGCYATRARDEVAALPGVVEVVTDKRELPDLLGRFGVVDIPTGISGFGNRHRAYVKVQDGCMLRCSFCIIPYVRPELTSRPTQHILDEVQRLVAHGYREVVLTGIHLGHYGVEWNRSRPKDQWIRLSTLLRKLAALPGEFRVRLSSIEATEVTRELIRVMSDHGDRICPHLHISMQSGSDRVLRRMRRRWGRQRFIDRCEMVREALDCPAFTTDVIVGFPGATDADFEETCQAVRDVGFSKVHIFPFSPRRGTPAADMPDQLPKKIKSQRGRHLAAVASETRDAYFSSLVGKTLRVLVESPLSENANALIGTSCRYAPVVLPATDRAVGQFADVVSGPVVDGQIHAADAALV